MAPTRSLPSLPAKHSDFLSHVNSRPDTPIQELVKPYNEHDAVLRQIFAQEPSNPVVADNHVNVVPLYDANGSSGLRVRARDPASEPKEVNEKYVMPLKDKDRRPNGSPAVVETFKEFKTNFDLFSEGSLGDIDWNNVVAAGSAVVTALLPVPEEYRDSKRALRQFYHDKFAPASDVDLFIYGLTEEQAVEKVKQIEKKVKDSILYETTTIRTKNTITIASQYPCRHVQIVLRVYKSIAEILTGFDVDCACGAYDGQNVYVAPRAVAAYVTQANQIDLTRRSPSYENRLSKYSHRGFEVFWPQLDRSRIDPTIFERSFTRTVGLARLLVLEKLPSTSDRDDYLQQRRRERGRPALNLYAKRARKLKGNIKDDWEDEVAEWVAEEDVSNYHTFTIPYGQNYHARKIERLLYTKDLLLNSEWNNKDREVNLHRHPAFVGNAEDVVQDCCGFCPKPVTPEEQEVWEKESKIYISGEVTFLKDDPGRQEIGSFNPITETDWTEMAYVGNTALLFEAIVDDDLEAVKEWLSREDADPNSRDHTGRTPLHFAAMSSTPEIVQCLVDHGARLIWRIADGRTALHLAAARGSTEIVKVLLTKSEENEEAEEAKKDKLRAKGAEVKDPQADQEDDDIENISNASGDADDHTSFVTGSFVDVKKDDGKQSSDENMPEEGKSDEPDVYDINVVSWDSKTSPLHLAILHGHTSVVEELVSSFGADVLLPIKLINDYDRNPTAAILPLVLALSLTPEKAAAMTETLLRLGATPAQGDLSGKTPLHYFAASSYPKLFDKLLQHDEPGVKRAINHLALGRHEWRPSGESALTVAIKARNRVNVIKLLEAGAGSSNEFTEYLKSAQQKWDLKHVSSDVNERRFHESITQPIVLAADTDQPLVALDLLTNGADPNTLDTTGYSSNFTHRGGQSLLDIVAKKIERLRGYKGETKFVSQKPLPLDKDDQTYLGPYQEGGYQMFFAKHSLKDARKNYEDAQNRRREEWKRASNRKGLEEKELAIKALIPDFQALETALLAKGAKTFAALHPDIEPHDEGRYGNNDYSSKQEPFKIDFKFTVPDLTGAKREGYLRLFEAAWLGDLDTIKALTLSMWGPNNEEPPLQIAVTDGMNFSPFSLAVLRGHLDVAKAVLEMARAQYKPKEAKGTEKFHMRTSDDEENDCSSDDDEGDYDGVRIRSEVVHDEFTIDNIGDATTKVESHVTPLDLCSKRCQAYLFTKDTANGIAKSPQDKNWCTLVEYATTHDDVDLLIFLLELEQSVKLEGEEVLHRFHESTFNSAIKLGRLRCLSEIIKRTGVGLPLDELVQKSGIEVKQKPKYYQGLSIHGKKRADWAAAGRGTSVPTPDTIDPPLLIAAHSSNLASVEWFISTAPGRHYTDFANAHKQDKRLKRLARTEQGIEGSVMGWLNKDRDLVLHAAILTQETDEAVKTVEYIAKHVPSCLEVKSADGYTPLAIAFSRRFARIAKVLIDAGANQATRDAKGNNLIHLALADIHGETGINSGTEETENKNLTGTLQKLFELLDARLVPSLLTERSSEDPGSLTPISRWMHRVTKDATYHYAELSLNRYRENDAKAAVLRLLLDFAEPTGQKHLELLDGAGNTPVHDAVKLQLPKILGLMLDRRPDLLNRENAVGATPADVARDAWIAEATRDVPSTDKYSSTRASHELLRRDLGSFVRVEETTSERKAIYDLCTKKENEGAGEKRKLVSLFEANEVAKRLATRESVPHGTRVSNSWRRRYGVRNDVEGDIVMRWY